MRAWVGEDLHQPHNQLTHCSTSRAMKISRNPFDDNEVETWVELKAWKDFEHVEAIKGDGS